MKDRLTPELRKIEKEIDHYYKSNPLMSLPFATAAWSLLAFGEEMMLKQASRPLTPQEQETMGDNFVNELKQPMCWLYDVCEPGGQVPFVYDGKIFQASWDLLRLGKKYQWFDAAYRYASWGWIDLELQGSTIQPTENLFTGLEYEAYNRLIKLHKSEEAVSLVDLDNFHLLTDVIWHSVKVKGDRLRYKLNPRIVSDTIKVLRPAFDVMFSLPSEWLFSRYSLGDFRKVFEAISAIVYIHAMVRKVAAAQGYDNGGYANSVYVPTPSELLRRVVRYSGVSDAKVRSIFDDLSYGNRGISRPDPALQPLIKLNSEYYAIMPHLWILLAPERNLTVLFNKLPSEKKIYANLVSEKEKLMRERLTTCLSDKDFRFIWGSVPDLPDVDLAIVKDSEKACLLLELKWFIGPAEIREIIDKSEEIEKGISQVLKLKRAFANNHEPLLEKFQINSSYSLEGVVVSENWIGEAKVQSPEIPVIQADHLIAKLKATKSLESTIEWLKARKYLPKEGEHFKMRGITATIGNWSMKWYGLQPLIGDAFFPL